MSIALVAVMATGGAGAGDRADAARRLVLFGAHWCAPCTIELRDLPAIAAAAKPEENVVLAWIDAPPSVPASLAGKVEALRPDHAQRLAERVLGEGYGLPSAAMLDAEGRACAVWRAPLRDADVQVLRGRCR